MLGLAPLLGRLGLGGRAAGGLIEGNVPRAGGGLLARGAKGVDWLNAGNQVAQNVIPQIKTHVSVTVQGQPGCDYRQLYRLGLAIAYGAIKARKNAGLAGLLPPASALIVHFDPVNLFLGIELSLSCSGLGNLLDAVAGQAKGEPIAELLPIFKGFPEAVEGDEFSALNWTERRFLGQLPQLEGAGKTLLTTRPTLPAPSPGGDRVGRGFLEGVVARSLLEPEYLIAHPEIVIDDPSKKRPGSPGAFSPVAGKTVSTPAQNAGEPFWKRAWFNRNVLTPPGAG